MLAGHTRSLIVASALVQNDLIAIKLYGALAKLYTLSGYFQYESRKLSGIQITLTLFVTSCKICVSVFEGMESDHMIHTRKLPFHFLFSKF